MLFLWVIDTRTHTASTCHLINMYIAISAQRLCAILAHVGLRPPGRWDDHWLTVNAEMTDSTIRQSGRLSHHVVDTVLFPTQTWTGWQKHTNKQTNTYAALTLIRINKHLWLFWRFCVKQTWPLVPIILTWPLINFLQTSADTSYAHINTNLISPKLRFFHYRFCWAVIFKFQVLTHKWLLIVKIVDNYFQLID